MGLERQEEMSVSTSADDLRILSYYDAHKQTHTDPEPAGFADYTDQILLFKEQ